SRIVEIDFSSGGQRLAGDGEDRDRSVVAIGDERERPGTIDRDARRSEAGLPRRDHRRPRCLKIDHRNSVVGNELGSAASSFMLEDMGAIDSSGAIATFCGGPTTLDGALSSPITLGGETPRSIMVTVSSAGFGGTVFTPLTSTALASLAETASCA